MITGLYARLSFPGMADANGAAINMDSMISAYVVKEFPVYVGLIVILGLLSAGLSTLEGLIQSIPTSITSDFIEPLTGNSLGEGETRQKRLIFINKIVIGVVGVVSVFLSYDQLVNPSLSVGILLKTVFTLISRHHLFLLSWAYSSARFPKQLLLRQQ